MPPIVFTDHSVNYNKCSTIEFESVNFIEVGTNCCCWQPKPNPAVQLGEQQNQQSVKVIYPKYSKHLPYTVAHAIDCVCSKMLNHGLNHGLFLSLFKFFG